MKTRPHEVPVFLWIFMGLLAAPQSGLPEPRFALHGWAARLPRPGTYHAPKARLPPPVDNVVHEAVIHVCPERPSCGHRAGAD